MKFTGLFGLPVVDPVTNKEGIQAIPFATIRFRNSKNVVKETEVDSLGKYSVDLAVEEYSIEAYIRGTSQGISYIRQGVKFPVTSTSKVGDFDLWLQSSAVGDDDKLLEQWKKVLFDLKVEHQNVITTIDDFNKSMDSQGYINTKNATLAYLFGNPANGRYKTQDNDPAFIDLTPLNATNAYVDVFNYFTSNGSYIKLEWTYSGYYQGQRSFQILKTNGEWGSAIEIIKGESIGNANGKWLKEGAYGLGTIGNAPSLSTEYDANTRLENGFYKVANGSTGFPSWKESGDSMLSIGWGSDHFSNLHFNIRNRLSMLSYRNGIKYDWVEFYSTGNTKTDKNNVLHATTSTPKDTMLVGDFGVGSANPPAIDVNNLNEVVTCFSSNFGTTDDMPSGSKAGIVFKRGADITHLLYSRIRGDVYLTTKWGDRDSTTNSLWGTINTTVDSNGFIKKASPIIKLFDDHIEWNQDFKEEPVFEKLDIGVYKISNTNGLARGITHGDWYIETPKNRNGLPYFMVEWEQDDITDDVIIKVFDRKFDINIGDFVNGEPRDIGKDERWIDLRFHEQIYSLTNELPEINIPYRESWGVEPYVRPVIEEVLKNEEDQLQYSIVDTKGFLENSIIYF